MSAQKVKTEKFDLHLKQYSICQGESDSQLISGGDDYTIKFFDLESREVLKTLDSEDEINSIFYIKEKNIILFAFGTELKLQELTSETSNLSEALSLTKFNTIIKGIKYSDEFNLVFAFAEDEEIHMININTYEINKQISNHEGSIKNMLIKRDLLVTTGYDGNLIINKISSMGIQYKSKVKILGNKLKQEDIQNLSVDIYEKRYLLVGGNFMLKKIKVDSEENLINPIIEMESGLCHSEDIIYLKLIHKNILSTLDKSGNTKISYLKSIDSIDILFSFNIFNEINFEEKNKLDKILFIEGKAQKAYFCIGNQNGKLFFGDLPDISNHLENNKRDANSMDVCEEDIFSKKEHKKEKKVKKEKKNKKDRKNKSKKEKKEKSETLSFLDDEASAESDKGDSGDDRSEEDEKNNQSGKEDKKSSRGDEDLMDISELEDENGDFRSPEEIEKSIFLNLI